jgi:hypothetical protein
MQSIGFDAHRQRDWLRYLAIILSLVIAASACGNAGQDGAAADSAGGQSELPLAAQEAEQETINVASSGCINPPSGLVAWWTFDIEDDDHDDLVDGYKLTSSTAVVGAEPGVVGNGAEVGSTHLRGSGRIGWFDGSEDFTIDAWIKPVGEDMAIFDTRGDDDAGALFRLNEGRLLLQLNTGSKFLNLQSTESVPPGEWSLVSVSVDRDGETFFTIDDRSVGTHPSVLPEVDVNPGQVTVGYDVFKETGFAGGMIDELEVFDRALAADEVFELYRAGDKGKCHPSCVSPPEGLVAWWTFDTAAPYPEELSRTLPLQAEITGNGVTAVAGMVNGAVDLNRGFLTVDRGLGLGTGDFTIDAWIRPRDGDMAIFDTRSSSADSRGVLFNLYQGRLLLQINDGTGSVVNRRSSAQVQPDEWSLVSASVDRDGETRFTINGKFAGSSPTAKPGVDVTTGRVVIGRDVYDGDNEAGQIDELEVFDRALADSELSSIFDARGSGKCRPTCTSPPDGLVAWWTFDESGDQQVDLVDGYEVAARSGSIGQVAGMVDDAADFGPAYLAGEGAIEGLDGLGDFTIDAWIKPVGDAMAIFDTRESSSSDEGVLLRLLTQQLLFQMNDGSKVLNTKSTSDVPIGEWSLISVSVDRDGDTSFTINGVNAGSSASVLPAADVNPGQVTIGHDIYFTSGFDGGQIDELEVFNRALPDEEIFSLYRWGDGGKCRDVNQPPRCTTNPPPGSVIDVGDVVTATVDGLPAGAVVDFNFSEANYAGLSSTEKAHQYTTPGNHRIGLTWSWNGQTGTLGCGGVEVVAAELACVFEPLSPLEVGQLFSVQLSGAAAAQWDLGDSNLVYGAQATHAYTAPGTFTIAVTTEDGRSHTCDVTVIGDDMPQVRCVISPTAATIGDQLALTLTESPSTGLTYEVDFGDGTVSTASSGQLTHTYTSAGAFTVSYRARLNGQWTEWINCSQVNVAQAATPVEFELGCVGEGWQALGRDVSTPPDGETDFTIEAGDAAGFVAQTTPANGAAQVTWSFTEIQGTGATHPDVVGQAVSVTLPLGWWQVEAMATVGGDTRTTVCPGTYIVNG